MLYVGNALPPIAGRRAGEEDPALIDPHAAIDQRRPDWEGQQMGYWPSYSQIAPGCRAAYLSWLAAGRREGAYVGYVFLFFYGLERRALLDSQTDPTARAELPQIRAEVLRLLDLYGENRSFHGYATAFVDTLDVLTATGNVCDGPPPKATNYWELPPRLKVGLAQFAADNRPIPADWALAWLRAHPEVHLRTPAKRCPDEFTRLFAMRYRSQFGDGMVVKANKTKLRVRYQPASASFGGAVELHIGDLPDVSALAAPIKKLRPLAESCTDDLDAYSRWIGRNADSLGTLPSLALLPRDLIATTSAPRLDDFTSWARRTVGVGDEALIDAGQLIERWQGRSDAKLSKSDSAALCSLADSCGYGVEPDVRFGSPTISPGPAVLFRNGESPDAVVTSTYAAAMVLLDLASVIANADGEVSAPERHQLTSYLEEALTLPDGARRRLHAHLSWVLAAQPSLAGMKKRLEPLTPAQREGIGSFLIALAAADGIVRGSEIDALTKVYALLGLDRAGVYSQLHALGGPAEAPVVVRPARPSAAGEHIPTRATTPGSIALDPIRVQRRLAESEEVAALLSSVFSDDELGVPSPPLGAPDSELVAGLDASHTALLKDLASKPTWTRDEFTALARARNLLPDGAIDMINEAAIDASGEPLCDVADGDAVTVNGYALQELLQ
jgi:uncharacterized tellurite resistance protein B-like protein